MDGMAFHKLKAATLQVLLLELLWLVVSALPISRFPAIENDITLLWLSGCQSVQVPICKDVPNEANLDHEHRDFLKLSLSVQRDLPIRCHLS
jgi:hypothetical protein